jgi:hypothetical protein
MTTRKGILIAALLVGGFFAFPNAKQFGEERWARWQMTKLFQQFPRETQINGRTVPFSHLDYGLQRANSLSAPIIGWIDFSMAGVDLRANFEWHKEEWRYASLASRRDGRDLTYQGFGLQVESSYEVRPFLALYGWETPESTLPAPLHYVGQVEGFLDKNTYLVRCAVKGTAVTDICAVEKLPAELVLRNSGAGIEHAHVEFDAQAVGITTIKQGGNVARYTRLLYAAPVKATKDWMWQPHGNSLEH